MNRLRLSASTPCATARRGKPGTRGSRPSARHDEADLPPLRQEAAVPAARATAGSRTGRAGTARGAARGARATAAWRSTSGALEPAELSRLAVEGPTTRVRQAAAAAIDDPALLARAAAAAARQGQGGLQADQAEVRCAAGGRARRPQAAAQEAAALCESLERHAARAHDSLYEATLASLATRWQALAAPVRRRRPAARTAGARALPRGRGCAPARAGATGRGTGRGARGPGGTRA